MRLSLGQVGAKEPEEATPAPNSPYNTKLPLGMAQDNMPSRQAREGSIDLSSWYLLDPAPLLEPSGHLHQGSLKTRISFPVSSMRAGNFFS